MSWPVGTAAAYSNDSRYQRRPSENINFGRVFHIGERMSLTMRMEFSNIFNRTEMANPGAPMRWPPPPTPAVVS